MAELTPDEVRERVRAGYNASSVEPAAAEIALRVGYTQAQLDSLPAGANVGFGCGSPTSFAGLEPGEVVVDLGSGAGVDVFLAAQAVAPGGRAIGIDMTPLMIERARAAASGAGLANAEFHEASIEALPLPDECADAVISNGVINYSPERARTLDEALRVLRPGGRLVVADLVLARPFPESVARVARIFLGNPPTPEAYLAAIEAAGFHEVEVLERREYGRLVFGDFQGFRPAAKEDGAPDEAVEQLLDDLSSRVVRARK